MDAAGSERRGGETIGNLRAVGRRIAENPVAALLAALGAGFVIGLVLRLFERPHREVK